MNSDGYTYGLIFCRIFWIFDAHCSVGKQKFSKSAKFRTTQVIEICSSKKVSMSEVEKNFLSPKFVLCACVGFLLLVALSTLLYVKVMFNTHMLCLYVFVQLTTARWQNEQVVHFEFYRCHLNEFWIVAEEMERCVLV